MTSKQNLSPTSFGERVKLCTVRLGQCGLDISIQSPLPTPEARRFPYIKETTNLVRDVLGNSSVVNSR